MELFCNWLLVHWQATTEIPDSFMCKRDPAKLQDAVAKAVGAPAIVSPCQEVAPSQTAGSDTQLGNVAGAAGSGAAAAASGPGGGSSANTFARSSGSSGEGGPPSLRRPSGGAASDASSALRSSQSDGSNTATAR